MTAVTASRVGKGTESPNRLSGGRGGAEAELLEPRGMTSSSAWGSQGLKIRALAGPRALTRRVRRGAAPRSRCGSGTARTREIPARLNQGTSPPATSKHLSAGPSPEGARSGVLEGSRRIRVGSPRPGQPRPFLSFSLIDLEPRAGARASAPAHPASRSPCPRQATKREGKGALEKKNVLT